MDEQRDTLRWFRGVHYLISAVGNKRIVVGSGQLIELLSEELMSLCGLIV